MNALPSILVLVAAFLAVFWEAAFNGIRHLLGAQIDLLPPLMVYASLWTNVWTVVALALVGGLGFDALSANPLGVSVLPLFVIGFIIHTQRALILREQVFAQFVLGLAASAAVPVMVVTLLLTAGHQPLLGWGSLWQWIVVSMGGAVATPALFVLFGVVGRALSYGRQTQTTFRADREIRRGR